MKPNGSEAPYHQWADLVTAAATGGDPVGGPGHRPGGERWHQEPRGAPTLVEPVSGGEKGSGALPPVLDRDVDTTLGTHLEARWADPSRDDEVGCARETEPERAAAEQGERGQCEREQFDRAEQEAADCEPGGGSDQRPASPRELDAPAHGRRQRPVAPGTATEASTASTTSPVATPRSCASGASSTRCSITADITRFTSSGITNARP